MADDLGAFIRELRRLHEAEELSSGPFSLGPNPGDRVANLRWHVQLLLDEVDVYAAMPKAERAQEPWLTLRRALAEELRTLQRAMQRQRQR